MMKRSIEIYEFNNFRTYSSGEEEGEEGEDQ